MAIGKDNFENAVLAAMKMDVERIIEEESSLAAERVKERVKKNTAGIVANISNWMDYESFRDRVVLTVRFPESK